MNDQSDDPDTDTATPAEIERARADYADEGQIEIDDEALCSRVDGEGTWVQAWVWLANEE